MQTIYSLKEFYQQVKELAASKGIDYVHVRVNFGTHTGLEFSCYAHGADWYTAPTPEEALAKLRNKLYPIHLEDQRDDVAIDLATAPETIV